MPDVYVALGSNVEPEHHLEFALGELEAAFGPLTLSGVYRNAAVGFDGDDFLNLVVGFSSTDSAPAIVAQLDIIEFRCGRERGSARFAPRTLDLDLLLYGDEVVDDAELTLPRTEILEYSFVLKPLADIAGERRHPVNGQTFAELWAAFDHDQHPLTPVPWPVSGRNPGVAGDY